MEAVDPLRGSWHSAAINEGLAHNTKPAFKPALKLSSNPALEVSSKKTRWDFCMCFEMWGGKDFYLRKSVAASLLKRSKLFE